MIYRAERTLRAFLGKVAEINTISGFPKKTQIVRDYRPDSYSYWNLQFWAILYGRPDLRSFTSNYLALRLLVLLADILPLGLGVVFSSSGPDPANAMIRVRLT